MADMSEQLRRPDLVTIGDRAAVPIRATVIAHFREQLSVVIEEDATVGPGAIVLPNVTIGRGSIVTAGRVVAKSVPPKTMVQGNPAPRPIARVEIPLALNVSVKEFAKGLRSIVPTYSRNAPTEDEQVAFCVKSLRSKNYCSREGRAHP
jgi:carbonic anhydrase/acetyltransferase-like protein (isoleucine patch superfamily)